MSTTEYKNDKGHKVGSIKMEAGYMVAYDYKGQKLGKYDSKTNKTIYANGAVYGEGNMLTNFFTMDEQLKAR